ncbi:DUF3006 family protein [Planococcus salinus]|uniref:DUF3006 family protein n=1 Tax=Planococcus salinus TaxID=1848460 RepID=A0A3M8P7V2_9BACL|nr:DUF3006 family protein [Planococcus salinus]RNF39755.1 DUF3006 family protein [Planococcus salinus]
MREGKYTIDSIENGIAKLLFQKDETIEEYLREEEFAHQIYQGLVVHVSQDDNGIISKPFYEETQERQEYARNLMEKLKRKK